MQRLPFSAERRARAFAGRAVWADRASDGRHVGRCRSSVHHGFDPASEEAGRRRLCPDHAVFCRSGQRRAFDEIAGLYRIAFRRNPLMALLPVQDEILPGTGPNYLTNEWTVKSWLLTRDHKRIALMFFASITFFFFIGGIAATLIRMQLATPDSTLLKPDVYNRMFTMHGVVMVWFFLIPSIPATLGNFLIPLMIGSHDLAFPRLNLG